MTTLPAARVERFPDVTKLPEAMEQLISGLRETDTVAATDICDANREAFWTIGPDGYEVETDALHEFDRIRDEATAEIAPEVARLLTEAINRRLPWTCEPK